MQIVVPTFKAPAAKSNKRTGQGDRHRPHRFVKGASIPVVIILILASAITIYLSFDKIFGSQAPENYSMMEIIAARSWCGAPCVRVAAHVLRCMCRSAAVGMALCTSACGHSTTASRQHHDASSTTRCTPTPLQLAPYLYFIQ